MSKVKFLEELLRTHKVSKERVIFLENHRKRLIQETHEDYIECKMYGRGYSGATPRFVMENGVEVSQLNKVEEASLQYRRKCESEYFEGKAELIRELSQLQYYTALIEDGLDTLGRVNDKLRTVVEGYYINNVRMEDIAGILHISRSRCYEMRNEGLRMMARVIYGDAAV